MFPELTLTTANVGIPESATGVMMLVLAKGPADKVNERGLFPKVRNELEK